MFFQSFEKLRNVLKMFLPRGLLCSDDVGFELFDSFLVEVAPVFNLLPRLLRFVGPEIINFIHLSNNIMNSKCLI